MSYIKISLTSAILILSLSLAEGCSSPESKKEQKQNNSQQEAKGAARATPPKDWIKSELQMTKINIYFPTEPRSRVTAPDFMEEKLEEKIKIFESRTGGELRCQVAEYRVKPSLSQPDQGLKDFTMESLKAAVRFQHNVPNYDLDQDPDKLLKRLEKTTIGGNPSYVYELQVNDGTFEGCAIYNNGYIVMAWAATNAKTTDEWVKKRRLFVNCVGAE